MAKEDIHNQRLVLNRNYKRQIKKLCPADQGDVKKYLDDLAANGFSHGRINKVLNSLVTIKRNLKKPFKEADKEDVKRFAVWLERSEYKDWTKHDLKVILRQYMRWLGKAETVDWMRIKQPNNGTLPEEILTEEEIKRLAEAAYTTRDRAFILALYESGARIGEFLPLKIKHLSFDRHGARVYLSGKTGDRRPRLVASTLALQRWLEEHPAKHDSEAYLWCKIPMPNNPKWRNQHLSYGFICRLLRELAAKARIKKKVNPHSFRHARATFMAPFLTEAQLRIYFGWSKKSKMPSTYVHLSGRDVDNAVLGIYGVKEARENQEPVLKVQQCPRCQELNDPASRFCARCGLPLNQPYAGDRLEELLLELLKTALQKEGMRERFIEVMRKKNATELFG
jgi:site-specific recombinase XerD